MPVFAVRRQEICCRVVSLALTAIIWLNFALLASLSTVPWRSWFLRYNWLIDFVICCRSWTDFYWNCQVIFLDNSFVTLSRNVSSRKLSRDIVDLFCVIKLFRIIICRFVPLFKTPRILAKFLIDERVLLWAEYIFASWMGSFERTSISWVIFSQIVFLLRRRNFGIVGHFCRNTMALSMHVLILLGSSHEVRWMSSLNCLSILFRLLRTRSPFSLVFLHVVTWPHFELLNFHLRVLMLPLNFLFFSN